MCCINDSNRNPLSALLQSADSIVSTLSDDAPVLNDSVILSAEVAEDLIDAAQTIILCGEYQTISRGMCSMLTRKLGQHQKRKRTEKTFLLTSCTQEHLLTS